MTDSPPNFASHARRRGFTLIELLLVIAIVALCVGILVPAVITARRSAQSTRCMANLRQIALAFRQYAMDNNDILPDPFVNKKSWEASLETYAGGPGLFVCPADNEVAPAIGSSYDWRDTGKDPTTLAGKPFSITARPDAVLALDALPGWHARRRINAACVDGSVRQMEDRDCFTDLLKPVR